MLSERVKPKLRAKVPLMLALLAIASFLASWLGWFRASAVERWFSRGVFPIISSVMGLVSDLSPFSLMDLLIPTALFLVGYLVYRRRFAAILGLLSGAYLVFFWTWGLGYHREPLVSKLDFGADRVTEESVRVLTREAAESLNRLHAEVRDLAWDDEHLRSEASDRVAAVVRELDGIRWRAGSRVKHSWVLGRFFRASGIDGMFNPFGHEALVVAGLLPFERPMIVAHEMAHVRGYPDEGDANFVALMAVLNSPDPGFSYSGWLHLWLYLRGSNELLDRGPLRDLEAIRERVLRSRVQWVSRAQSRTLDTFLKLNRVEEGVRSYARIVSLAVGTRDSWDRFAPAP